MTENAMVLSYYPHRIPKPSSHHRTLRHFEEICWLTVQLAQKSSGEMAQMMLAGDSTKMGCVGRRYG